MISIQDDGFYSRTGAYNFLKNLLGVSPKVLIKKSFFNLFFSEVDSRYKIKKGEEIVKELFQKESIATINEQFYALKQSGNSEKAEKLYVEMAQRIAA